MKRPSISTVIMVLGILVLVIYVLPWHRGDRVPPRSDRARRELRELLVGIRAYHGEFGEFPPAATSNNVELVQVLAGRNPGQVAFLNFWPHVVTNRLSYLDPWGGAYRFKAEGGTNLCVWSCGPNRLDEAGQGDDLMESFCLPPK